ncbi:MAG: cell wall-active antibiotics response protein [Clostridia bacterium]|nr:cell wall-active antibiotics response protein [Clostridia bacterium]
MRFFSGRLIIGLTVVAIGAMLLLNNLVEGIDFNVGQLLRTYWPVILLILGLNWLFLSFGSASSGQDRKIYFSWGQLITALIAIAIGMIFRGRNLGLFYFDTRLFWNLVWPVVLILIGFNLMRGKSHSGGKGGRFTFMGGTNIGGAQPWKLESGSYFAFMGGIEMDLTAAEIPEGETVLDLTAIMGGIDVKIPKDLSVIYEGSAVLGGVTFKDQEDGGIIGGRKVEQNITNSTKNIVRIQARAIMGGIEIKEV